MLIHPQFDPVAVSLGPLSARWYGLMYLLAFGQFWLLGRLRLSRAGWSAEEFDDLLFYGMLGVVLGGRLGQVLFYEPAFYAARPWEIFAVWKGGMSFHGGFLGVLAAMVWHCRKHGRVWLEVADFVAPLVPLGLMFGRIGNFINGELWGRVADPGLPWAMIFPLTDGAPRHPSQLYHAGLEGLALFIWLWWYSGAPRKRGAVSGMFLLGYGLFRSFVECFREPDHGIFGFSYVVSMGQWLSLPMILCGLWLIWRARKTTQT
ncbi:MAG: prolipoprotein diacylglyceryl transferase [Zoogloeaceae bacterium]|jgi:phosphatidylglycerol:prolipoprotein diacylglycerol transferase|nr:prolipoprotein diacylglyceryl transferase [Zoogloeaceae bacterium]